VLIRMLTISAGPKGTADAGSIVDVDAKTGRQLVESGHACEVDSKGRRKETAMLTGSRNAMVPDPKSK
jgi:hypothetical protein